MRITFAGYEVEIKAKFTADGTLHEERRFNQQDTRYLLNTIACWALGAARDSETTFGVPDSEAERAQSQIYEYLKALGEYDEFEAEA